MPIPPVLVRRVNRVRDRMNADGPDPSDLILDDVFVLWRAFESTYPPNDGLSHGEAAKMAVGEAILYVGIEALPATAHLIGRLKYFENASPAQMVEWFEGDASQRRQSPESLLAKMRRLRTALEPPRRWDDSLARDVADILYRLRCAVIHPRLETDDGIALRVLPALRDSMIELTIGRAAIGEECTLTQARAMFDEDCLDVGSRA